jgi:cytochrome oxidase Cu insertion factor (SCO1/SenC/PrrC family)
MVAAATPASAAAHTHAGQQRADRNAFPDTPVATHDGRALMLYSDLVKGRVVTINFMSVDNEEHFPITAKMAAVAARLGTRLGRDVTMISITSDPASDTVKRLRSFAERFSPPPGWIFVRATSDDTNRVASRLYRHGRNLGSQTNVDIVHYGNDRVGLWAAFPAAIQPDDAAERVTWVMNGTVPAGPLRQAGPRRIGEAGPAMHNRIV